jgi:hypothetical protein
MMLVMQSHIISQQIQRSIIRKCLWDLHARLRIFGCCRLFLEDVVFRNEMACAGVERAC